MAKTITLNNTNYVLADFQKEFTAAQTFRVLELVNNIKGDAGIFLSAVINWIHSDSTEYNVAFSQFLLRFSGLIPSLTNDKNFKLLFLILFLPEGQEYTVEYDKNIDSLTDGLPPIPIMDMLEGLKDFFGLGTIATENTGGGSATEATDFPTKS